MQQFVLLVDSSNVAVVVVLVAEGLIQNTVDAEVDAVDQSCPSVAGLEVAVRRAKQFGIADGEANLIYKIFHDVTAFQFLCIPHTVHKTDQMLLRLIGSKQ